MKTVLFVPGFREDISSRDYNRTLATIESKSRNVKFVQINWARTTIDEWVQELGKEYSKLDPQQTILAGFSFGAITALVAAANSTPYQLWLFSLSPYFREDLRLMTEVRLARIGSRRQAAFAKLDFNELTRSIKCETLIFAGENECKRFPPVKQRALAAHRNIERSKLSIVPNADHDVTDQNYIDAICNAV